MSFSSASLPGGSAFSDLAEDGAIEEFRANVRGVMGNAAEVVRDLIDG